MPGSAGTNRGLQLWVNLPRRLKKIEPEYQAVSADQMEERACEGGRCRVIDGGLKTRVTYLDVDFDGRFDLDIPAGENTLLYVLRGDVEVAKKKLSEKDAVVLSDGRLRSEGKARFVLLSARPHKEPIRQRGPYVD